MSILKASVNWGLTTKTGMMVGFGESFDEVVDTMKQVRKLGVKIFTLGQYLQPTKNHFPVKRYISDREFADYKKVGLGLSLIHI